MTGRRVNARHLPVEVLLRLSQPEKSRFEHKLENRYSTLDLNSAFSNNQFWTILPTGRLNNFWKLPAFSKDFKRNQNWNFEMIAQCGHLAIFLQL